MRRVNCQNVSWKLITVLIAPVAAAGATDIWQVNGASGYYNAGDIGLGTSTPIARLHVVENSGEASAVHIESLRQTSNTQTTTRDRYFIDFDACSINSSGTRLKTSITPPLLPSQQPSGPVTVKRALYLNDLNNNDVYLAAGGGRVRVGNRTAPGAKLDVAASTGWALRAASAGEGLDNAALRVDNSHAAGIGIWSSSNSTDANLVASNEGSGDIIRGFHQGDLLFQVRSDGTTSVKVLEITGADLAERFPTTEKAEPGMVVEIDPDHAGMLRLARGAYNHRVAGVVSGAGDIPMGAVLGNLPGMKDAAPIALSGRVWVNCDAEQSSIEPGDLLTTSDLAGYAMKAGDGRRSTGAIIGKAMTSLRSGRGQVLVLVSLQ